MQVVCAGQDGYLELLLMQSDGTPITTGAANFYLRNSAGKWWTGAAWGDTRVVAAAGIYVSASAWACTIDADAFTLDGRYHVEAVHATISHLPASDSVIVEDTPTLSAIANAIAAKDIEVVAAVVGQVIHLTAGDAYDEGDRVLDFPMLSGEPWPTTINTADLTIEPAPDLLLAHGSAPDLSQVAATVVHATGASREVSVALTAAQTATLYPGRYLWWLVANRATSKATLRSGVVIVAEGDGT